jgi:hypothetical protein
VRNRGTRTLVGLLRHLFSVVAFSLLAASAYAQSCALCYTQAASSGSRLIQGLRSGILVLIIPPLFMSVGITVLAYKKRNQFSRTHHPDSDSRGRGW